MKLKIYFRTMVAVFLTLLSTIAYSATPTIDGTFDGLGVWGAPYASSDGAPGWASATAGDLYSTNDDNYYYFAVTVTADAWMNWAFIVNAIDGQGGTADSWSRTISYSHTEAPDYTFRGTFSGYAEYHTWNGAGWDGIGSAVAGTEFSASTNYIEIRIPRATMANVAEADVQFYITGNDNAHGSFDAVPDDVNVTEWNPPAPTPLSNYSESIILPVELGDVRALRVGNSVEINWSTYSEIDNDYFLLERSQDLINWTAIDKVEGAGNSTEIKYYETIDRQAPKSQTYYRISQFDYNGSRHFSEAIRVNASNTSTDIYPLPFQNTLTIQFEEKLSSSAIVSIFNSNGKLVLNKSIAEGISQVDLVTDELASGIYFIQVQGQSVNISKKILK